MSQHDLRSHMRAHYAPNCVVVAAAGNVEHDRFVELVGERFAEFEGPCAAEPDAPATTPARHVRFKDANRPTSFSGAVVWTSPTNAGTRFWSWTRF